YQVFRIVLALAAGGVGAVIPGILNVNIPKVLTAGGALAVFVVVYFYSPAQLAVKQLPSQSQANSRKQDGSPIIINQSGRLNRIASNDHCQGDERSWVDITSDVKIGLLGVRTGEKPGEENRVDIRVVQTRNRKTIDSHDIHP